MRRGLAPAAGCFPSPPLPATGAPPQTPAAPRVARPAPWPVLVAPRGPGAMRLPRGGAAYRQCRGKGVAAKVSICGSAARPAERPVGRPADRSSRPSHQRPRGPRRLVREAPPGGVRGHRAGGRGPRRSAGPGPGRARRRFAGRVGVRARTARAARRTVREPLPARRHGGTPGGGPGRRGGPRPRRAGRVVSASGGVGRCRVSGRGGGLGGPPQGRAPSGGPPDRCPAATRSGPAGRTASGG